MEEINIYMNKSGEFYYGFEQDLENAPAYTIDQVDSEGNYLQSGTYAI